MTTKIAICALLLCIALISAKWVWIEETDEEAAALSAMTLGDDDANKAYNLAMQSSTNGFQGVPTGKFSSEKLARISAMTTAYDNMAKVMSNLLSLSLDHAARDAYVTIRNDNNYPAKFMAARSNGMNKWNGVWSAVTAGAEKKFNIQNSNMPSGYANSNADAGFSIYCPISNTEVKFEIRVRAFDSFEVYIYDNWNPCYDFYVSGVYTPPASSFTNNKVTTISLSSVRVVKTLKFPNYRTDMKITIQSKDPADSNTVTMFESCSYQGARMAVTGSSSWIGGEWNDRVSSMIVPPGYVLVAYENGYFGGASKTYAGDYECMDGFNDAVSSFKLFKLQNGQLIQVNQ